MAIFSSQTWFGLLFVFHKTQNTLTVPRKKKKNIIFKVKIVAIVSCDGGLFVSPNDTKVTLAYGWVKRTKKMF